HFAGDVREQPYRLLPREISDGAAEECDERWARYRRQSERFGYVRYHRLDLDVRVIDAQLQRGRLQKILADVDGHVTLGASVRPHLVDDDASLRRAAGAELYE